MAFLQAPQNSENTADCFSNHREIVLAWFLYNVVLN